LSKEQRAKNLQEVFVVQNMERISQWATVLLVDDVTTTGSTLLQLARVIKKQRKDVKIWGAVLARNMGEK
jgi:predicted amidophosphoribosyltransferase